MMASSIENSIDIDGQSDQGPNMAAKTYASVTDPRKSDVVNGVTPVFILESDLFGDVKPTREQYVTHTELYKAIDRHVSASHLKAIQRVSGGMWRIYFDSEDDRNTLIMNSLVVREKMIPVHSVNPRVKVHAYRGPEYLKVRVKNVPCSADDGQISRSLELLGCNVHNLYRERLRVDGMLTNCQTGDRIVIIDPVSKPLPRTLMIGKYRALIFHRNQLEVSTNVTCNKCLQKGHKIKDCENDWVCKSCNGVGHKQSECTASFSDTQDAEGDETVEQNNEHIDSQSDEESSSTEEPDTEIEEEQLSQSILKPVLTPTKQNKKYKKPKTIAAKHGIVGTSAAVKSAVKKQGQIEWFLKDQTKNVDKTPKSKKDKRNATTPTDELRTREGPAHKTKP